MGYWISRIPVEVRNTSGRDVAGETLIIKAGNGKGLLPLAGEDASALRL